MSGGEAYSNRDYQAEIRQHLDAIERLRRFEREAAEAQAYSDALDRATKRWREPEGWVA